MTHEEITNEVKRLLPEKEIQVQGNILTILPDRIFLDLNYLQYNHKHLETILKEKLK